MLLQEDLSIVGLFGCGGFGSVIHVKHNDRTDANERLHNVAMKIDIPQVRPKLLDTEMRLVKFVVA